MVEHGDFGNGSYLNYLWRLADSVAEPVALTVASALSASALSERTHGAVDGNCRAWRQTRWRLDWVCDDHW